LRKLVEKMGSFFNWIAILSVLLMFVVITADILSSKILNKPITAAFDIVSLLGICVASFSLAETIIAGRHIEVEFIVAKMPFTVAKVLNVLSRVLSIVFFILIVWRSFIYGYHLQLVKEATMTQRIPVAPFVYAIGVACIPAIFIYAIQAYQNLKIRR